jgi:YVTN family beta-propeller protein
MSAKTSMPGCPRRRPFQLARSGNCLIGVAAFVLIATQASAFTAYVSNEKSNTVSVIDTDKFVVVNTIKVGQRPRGIELTKDGKFVLVAVGDDDTIQVIDVKTHEQKEFSAQIRSTILQLRELQDRPDADQSKVDKLTNRVEWDTRAAKR